MKTPQQQIPTDDTIANACKALSVRVAPMYKVVNWKWQGNPVTERMLFERAKELMRDLMSKKPLTKRGRGITSTGTGGLVAYRYRDEEGDTCYEIRFIVSESLYG